MSWYHVIIGNCKGFSPPEFHTSIMQMRSKIKNWLMLHIPGVFELLEKEKK